LIDAKSVLHEIPCWLIRDDTAFSNCLFRLPISKLGNVVCSANMQYQMNSNLVEDIGEPHDVPLNIRLIPDPKDVYAMTLGAADVTNSYIYISNIRNSDGNLITPDQYKTKLEDGSIVMVNVSLKL
jgi:hypothetical protein